MASYAQTTIVGNLGKEPEVRYLANGDAVCNFSVAVTESWKDKSSGDKKEQTTWYRCNAFGKLAEICGKYLTKGSQVLVVGKMQCRDWDKDGVKQYSWELKADHMTMLGSKPEGGNRAPDSDSSDYAPAPAKNKPKPSFDDLGDDIPF